MALPGGKVAFAGGVISEAGVWFVMFGAGCPGSMMAWLFVWFCGPVDAHPRISAKAMNRDKNLMIRMRARRF